MDPGTMPPPNVWTAFGIQGLCLILIALLAGYCLRVLVPKLTTDWADQMERNREMFQAEQDAERKENREIHKELLETFNKTNSEQLTHFDRRVSEVVQAIRNLKAVNDNTTPRKKHGHEP